MLDDNIEKDISEIVWGDGNELTLLGMRSIGGFLSARQSIKEVSYLHNLFFRIYVNIIFPAYPMVFVVFKFLTEFYMRVLFLSMHPKSL